MTIDEWLRMPSGKYDRAIVTTLVTADDGTQRVYVGGGGWPEATTIAGSVLNNADPERVTRDGERIIIKLTEESAVYLIDYYDEDRDVYRCSRES